MENHTMILILMSATVDVAELKEAIPGAQDIEIDQHEYQVSRFFLQRDITKLTNVLELTARLIVTMHHERCDRDLVDGVPEGQHCDHFLVFCPGKPQIRALSNLLIRWQELGYTRGLEVVPMYSGESPETWQYFDQPVSGSTIYGRKMPYYLSKYRVARLQANEKDGDEGRATHCKGTCPEGYREDGDTEPEGRFDHECQPNGSDAHVCGSGHIDDRGPCVLAELEIPRGCELHSDSVHQ